MTATVWSTSSWRGLTGHWVCRSNRSTWSRSLQGDRYVHSMYTPYCKVHKKCVKSKCWTILCRALKVTSGDCHNCFWDWVGLSRCAKSDLLRSLERHRNVFAGCHQSILYNIPRVQHVQASMQEYTPNKEVCRRMMLLKDFNGNELSASMPDALCSCFMWTFRHALINRLCYHFSLYQTNDSCSQSVPRRMILLRSFNKSCFRVTASKVTEAKQPFYLCSHMVRQVT